jgi:broad specificity phosphatase PhoE
MSERNSVGLRLIIVRPGQTELDQQGRITGSLDVPLSQEGKQQVTKLASEFADLEIARIVSGPGTASRETADLLTAGKKIKIKVEDELRNFDCGLWHGMRIDELKENQPKLFKLWQEQPEAVQPPDGDSVEDAVVRVEKFVKKITKKFKVETIIVIAAEPIACILRSLLEAEEIGKYWTVESNCGTWFEVIKNFETV